MAEKTLATFRYDAARWELAKEKAKKEGTTVSALLSGFLDSFLDSQGDEAKNASEVNNLIDKKLEPIKAEIIEIRGALVKFVA